MNIYLDVDGVLLDNGKPAGFVSSFLSHVLRKYPDSTYWLTTRCNGDASDVLRQIQNLFDDDTQKLLEEIKPTAWSIVKTQAIDFTQPFLWFDDQLGFADKRALEENNSLDSLRRIDLEANLDQLSDEIKLLEKLASK